MKLKAHKLLAIVGPGILVAATGVGAGDLSTGTIVGSKLGVAVLWAVVLGAAIKFLLSEGLARWQLATGTTLLEGSVTHLGRAVQWIFLAYLLIWSYFVGSALMSACGVTAHAMLPIMSPEADKILYGLLHSAAAVVLVRMGGYRLFSKIMGVCIAVMFVVVVAIAIALQPSWSSIGTGIVWPTIPKFSGDGLVWTVALMGGVGGTLTVLCYGYWIREEGRQGDKALKTCRIDLAVGYAATALFGMAMVVIGSQLDAIEGTGVKLVANVATQLQKQLGGHVGHVAKWAFLVGAWGAVFSSLLGVWQSVPYVFADFWQLRRAPEPGASPRAVNTRCLPYQGYLFAIAIIPAIGLWTSFVTVQKYYAVFGALFMPMLAVALLILNGKTPLVGTRHRNSLLTTLLLWGTIGLFALAFWFKAQKVLFS
jgi:Mn2+/Fe2+ NRAMP family transporter